MKLIFIEGAFTGRQEILKPVGNVIGRLSTADIHLDDQGISRQHCRISRVEGQWLVEDLGSINGVLLNGTRIQGSAALQPGDRITLVNTVMAFADDHMPTPAAEAVRQPSKEPIARSAETSAPVRLPLSEPPLNMPPAIAAAPGAVPEPPEAHAPPKLSLPRRPAPPPPPLPNPASASGMPRPANATVGHTPPPRPIPIPHSAPPPSPQPVPPPPQPVAPIPMPDSTSLAPAGTVEPASNDDNRSQLWMRMVLIVIILVLAVLLVVVLRQSPPPGGANPPGGGTVNVLTPPDGVPASNSTVPVTDQVLLVPVPENGEILLEGTKPIPAPALVPGKAGTVVIRKPGYKDIQIQMGSGKMPPMVFEPKSQTVLITSAPAGAAVYKGGQFLGRTPCVIGSLPEGSHLLTVGGQDTRPAPLTVTVSRRVSNAVYNVKLTPMPVAPQ